MMNIKQFFEINHAPLFKIPLFWLATIIPLLIAFGLAVPLMQDLNFNFSKGGYKSFISIFSFPLWVASGSILFGIMVGRFHGSVQRHEAIQQTALNNNFHNYLEHRRIFDTSFPYDVFNVQLEQTEDPYFLVNINRDELYRYIFPFNSYTNFDIRLERNTQFVCERLYEEFYEDNRLLKIEDLQAAYVKYQEFFPATLYVRHLGYSTFGHAINLIITLRILYDAYPKISGIGLHQAEELDTIKLASLISKFSQTLMEQQEHPFLANVRMLETLDIDESENTVRVR